MTKRLIMVCVALPVVVMAAWLGRLQWGRNFGSEVQLAIEGYDPRDLLAGHYLRYTVGYGKVAVCPESASRASGPYCVCLASNGASGNHEAYWAGRCGDRDTSACPLFIKGICSYGNFQAEIERVYFPERFSRELQVVPDKAVIRVRLSGDGHGQVTKLVVDGVDMLEYAKSAVATSLN